MSPHQTVAVAVRLFAIWLAACTLRAASATFFGGPATVYGGPIDTKGLVIAGIIALLTLLVAAFLWFFPLSTANKLLPSPVATPAPAETPNTWLAMGCALIGLWLLASAIPFIVRDALMLYSSFSRFDDSEGIELWLAYRCAEVAVALWLIFGARGFVKVFWWIRTAGTEKPL